MRTVADVLAALPSTVPIEELPAPVYEPNGCDYKAALAVPSMAHHMSDEGWQIMQALQANSYRLFGSDLSIMNVKDLVLNSSIGTLITQDKREWDKGQHLAKPEEYFEEVEYLKTRPDIFKLTILKDSHQRPPYHRQSAEEIGCHAWIIYYHPKIVKFLAPYVREQHLVRTYHSINKELVPPYTGANRQGALLSGAISHVYPLRWALVRHLHELESCFFHNHPGYHNSGTNTPQYLRVLSQHKVAICTSSVYGYALRKIIEATACGCVVITDLPVDDPLPKINDNLVRLQSKTIVDQVNEVKELLPKLYKGYNVDRQRSFAEAAKSYYDYREVGRRLANDIESMRVNYNAPVPS